MNSFLRAWVFVVLAECVTHATPGLVAPGRGGDLPAAVTYTISLANREQHLARVQIILPSGHPVRELQLPVWNALYQIRDFSQYVNWIRAQDRAGTALAMRELDKSRWQIEGAANGAVVEYEIFLDSPGPFGAQLNSHHAFLNLAQVLMYPVDARNSQLTLHFSHVPKDWHIATPLRAGDDAYIAENYDRLVDSPVEIGAFQEIDFEQSGGHFRVIVDADRDDYNPEQLKDSLQKIVAAAITWMNDRPFDAYTFFYHFPRGPAGGGMEHAYSTAIEVNAATIKQNLYPVNSVTAHEFFHLWNVKRIRPRTLEPIDYTKENYTRALWFSEGVTSTVENVIQFRAGLIDEKQFLSNIGGEITELEDRPAHLTQSAEESSLDAWLEAFNYYRRPERSISYYNKGELLGILLDLAVREQSHGQASLREVMQWMNRNYAQKGRFFDDSQGVREAAEAISHADLLNFFKRYVSGTENIPWNDFFRSVGLRVEAVTMSVPDPGFNASRNFDGPVAVASVAPGSEAEQQGLRVGDIILEFQGKPAAEDFQQQMSRLTPGEMLSLKVRSRLRGEHELKWKAGSREETLYRLKDLDQVSPGQRARRAAWLKGEAEAPGVSPQ
ncbi:MAG TPA: PDZ domain-containing protein [Candidatus Sulfotelmatobacter sp.]|nr:PDZ domain-containing protein [Candidatus Sulfotelmatobacter sp.]